jgi:hypothetical protein
MMTFLQFLLGSCPKFYILIIQHLLFRRNHFSKICGKEKEKRTAMLKKLRKKSTKAGVNFREKFCFGGKRGKKRRVSEESRLHITHGQMTANDSSTNPKWRFSVRIRQNANISYKNYRITVKDGKFQTSWLKIAEFVQSVN